MRPHKLNDGSPIEDYQLRAAHKIFSNEGTPVIIDMGLGKTIITLTAIADMYAFGVLKKPVLVVAPILVCETVWRQEAASWSNTTHLTFSLLRGTQSQRRYALYRPAHIYLVNPESLDWLFKELRGNWDAFDMLVVDESSMFKSHSTKRFKLLTNYGDRHAIKGLDGKAIRDADGRIVKIGPHRFKRTAILTGTPSPTSLLNLWPQMYIVDAGKRLHKEFETYRDRYFYKTQKTTDHTFKLEVNPDELEVRPDWMPKDGAPIKIHEHIADIAVELNGGDFGKLPKSIGDATRGPVPPTHLHYVDLPHGVRAMYDKFEKEALIELGNDFILAANGGAKTMMCWQMANGFIYGYNETGDQFVEHLHEEKLDMLVDVLNRINASTVVPYYFKADYDRIAARLQKEGMAFSTLNRHGSERTINAWNKGQIPILLLHPQSAGHGINLQAGGHHMVWYTMMWSAERYQQANARLARTGQQNIVGVHHIVTRKTVDDLMLMTLSERGDTQTKFRSALRRYQAMRGWRVTGTTMDADPFGAIGSDQGSCKAETLTEAER